MSPLISLSYFRDAGSMLVWFRVFDRLVMEPHWSQIYFSFWHRLRNELVDCKDEGCHDIIYIVLVSHTSLVQTSQSFQSSRKYIRSCEANPLRGSYLSPLRWPVLYAGYNIGWTKNAFCESQKYITFHYLA